MVIVALALAILKSRAEWVVSIDDTIDPAFEVARVIHDDRTFWDRFVSVLGILLLVESESSERCVAVVYSVVRNDRILEVIQVRSMLSWLRVRGRAAFIEDYQRILGYCGEFVMVCNVFVE